MWIPYDYDGVLGLVAVDVGDERRSCKDRSKVTESQVRDPRLGHRFRGHAKLSDRICDPPGACDQPPAHGALEVPAVHPSGIDGNVVGAELRPRAQSRFGPALIEPSTRNLLYHH